MASRAASRQGLRILVIPVQPPIHRKLKVFAALSDKTLEQTCRLAFERFLDAAQSSLQRGSSA
jgi:hypothetical protein